MTLAGDTETIAKAPGRRRLAWLASTFFVLVVYIAWREHAVLLPVYAGLMISLKAVLRLFTPKLLLVLIKNGLLIKARQLATQLASGFFVLSHRPWRRAVLRIRLAVVTYAGLLLQRFLASPMWFRVLCSLALLTATAGSAYAFIALLIIPQAVMDWLKLRARVLLNKLGLTKALDAMWRWVVPLDLRERWSLFAKWRLGRQKVRMSQKVHQRVATAAKRRLKRERPTKLR